MIAIYEKWKYKKNEKTEIIKLLVEIPENKFKEIKMKYLKSLEYNKSNHIYTVRKKYFIFHDLEGFELWWLFIIFISSSLSFILSIHYTIPLNFSYSFQIISEAFILFFIMIHFHSIFSLSSSHLMFLFGFLSMSQSLQHLFWSVLNISQEFSFLDLTRGALAHF